MPAIGVKQGFWRGRRVFVTGHTGFIGGWLCLWLQKLGAQVVGYSLKPPSEPSFFESAGIADGMNSIIADVTDLNALSQALADAEPEIVFHLAAQALVRTAFLEPVHTFATNVMGTVNLLEAVRRPKSVRAVAVFTTDKVYDNREWVWGYRESDRLGAREAYGASKAAAEFVVDTYRQSYLAESNNPVGVATVRAGNVVGGGDWADERLVPDAMRAFAGGNKLWIRSPDAVRPWQHVLDPVRGLLVLGERLHGDAHEFSRPWNLGPAEEFARPVREVVDALKRLWGEGAQWKIDKRVKPYEARLLTLNSARAWDALGWRPAWNVEEMLARTVEWYRAFYAGADMNSLSLEQIAGYEAVLGTADGPAVKRSA
ncbi:MAG: CDP-glucose 4,6-dehydratase [Alphaproteobacteria bacterium]